MRSEGLPSIDFGEGEVFGETIILDGAVRPADIYARGDLVVLWVKKTALDRIIAEYPPVEGVLFGLLARHFVAAALEWSPLFTPFDPPTRAVIARSFEVRRARAGTMLQQTGKKGDALYLVLSGVVDAGEGDTPERLGSGTLFGYETLLNPAPASRTVTVVTETVLLRLPAAKFMAFVIEYPQALAHITGLAASR